MIWRDIAWAALAVAVVLLLALAPRQAGATGGSTPPQAAPTASATAGASAHAGATAGAVAGATAAGGSATGGSLSTGPVNAGGSQSEVSSYALGAPSVGNGANNCEMVIPIIGGSAPWEREACAAIRDARAVFDMVQREDGRDQVVKARLCMTERLAAAFEIAGRKCPKASEEHRR